jgi:hypothetical protein
MSVDVDLSKFATDRQALVPSRSRRRSSAHIFASVIAIGFCAGMLAACNHVDERGVGTTDTATKRFSTHARSRTPIPLPDQALLRSQPKPDCEFRAAGVAADNPQKLDYERICYRQSEAIVRSRLGRLQNSIRKTIEAVAHR